ncbi:hypothetical protein J2W32_003456 [Variovorax boronicumulans]|jgi:hypothetical protein|uniref:Uncharacterized protein n=1 Tax=Variovorax boronicumulans TaxID=436515 RepID=A0AAW8CW72_9BURK|nr:hypothetical protein [Variovorax boronicumulans]MDP9894580.1 hypothetical protein [Variovorax boronicumulans]MDQ0054399.1 hypothetical protein [Variovorax boronicumulans]MDQ0074800.1 hypothetical protein [Variovorax boronicumulans]
MTELTDLDEASLAEHAAEWRKRALRGEKQARGIAHALETEMRRRSGDTVTQNIDLDTRPQALRLAPRPWWKFW